MFNLSKRNRFRHSRSPIDEFSLLKRAKHDSFYTAISVRNIDPTISNYELRKFCRMKFSQYGSNRVEILERSRERIAIVTFESFEEARSACQATSGLVWANERVILEPYFRHDEPRTSRKKPSRNDSPSDLIEFSNRSRKSSSSSSSIKSTGKAPIDKVARTLIVENVDRDASKTRIDEIFSRFGKIEKIDLERSSNASKLVVVSVAFENVDMALKAFLQLNGFSMGKNSLKISFGKTNPSKQLWIGNIPITMKYQQLEYAFARFGQIQRIEYSSGDPTAVVSFNDVNDAVRARTFFNGATEIFEGRTIRRVPIYSSDFSFGLRVDFIEKKKHEAGPVVRSESESSSMHSEIESTGEVKTEARSPTPSSTGCHVPVKERRSTDGSDFSLPSYGIPLAGRTFYAPLGAYLSTTDTDHIRTISELFVLCEQFNEAATQSSTALSTVYPVDFVLKAQNYDARLHFLAGNSTLASLLLGQPGDLVAAKTELKITQRLRLDPSKLDDLERNIQSSVNFALGDSDKTTGAIVPNSNRTRKSTPIGQRAKFVILLSAAKLIKTERSSSPQQLTTERNDNLPMLKQEPVEEKIDEENSSLSRLVFYLKSKQAAGIIAIPFYPTHQPDFSNSSKQETAVLHIFPPCEFTEKILKSICPKIEFPTTKLDEYLMLIIVQND